METAVLRAQKRAHPVVREKHHTKHREKRLWLIDVLPMRPQRTDFSLWPRPVQPIRECKMYAYTMGLAEDILLYDPIFTDFAVVF